MTEKIKLKFYKRGFKEMEMSTIMDEIRVKVKGGKNRYLIFESEDDYKFVKSLEKALSNLLINNLCKDDEFQDKEDNLFIGILIIADYLKSIPNINIKVFVKDEKDFYKFPTLAKYFLPIRSSIYARFDKFLSQIYQEKNSIMLKENRKTYIIKKYLNKIYFP